MKKNKNKNKNRKNKNNNNNKATTTIIIIIVIIGKLYSVFRRSWRFTIYLKKNVQPLAQCVQPVNTRTQINGVKMY